MKEENSMVEYKESKGILNWFKSKFEKIKEIFRKTDKNISKSNDRGIELSKEELDKVEAGYPDSQVIDFDERKEIIENLEPKSWELTEEQLDEVKAGYPNVVPEKNEKIEEQELSEEDLDKITAGYPLNNDEYEK